MTALAGKSRQKFVATFSTFDPGKTVVKNYAIEITIDDLPYMSSKKPILLGKMFVVNLIKLFNMILNAPVVRCVLGLRAQGESLGSRHNNCR